MIIDKSLACHATPHLFVLTHKKFDNYVPESFKRCFIQYSLYLLSAFSWQLLLLEVTYISSLIFSLCLYNIQITQLQFNFIKFHVDEMTFLCLCAIRLFFCLTLDCWNFIIQQLTFFYVFSLWKTRIQLCALDCFIFEDKCLLPGGVQHVIVIGGKSHELANPITNSHLLKSFFIENRFILNSRKKKILESVLPTESSDSIGIR